VISKLGLKNTIHRGPRALAAVGSRFAAAAIMLLLLVSANVAQTRDDEGPFANLSGSWAGTGTVALSSGTKERIRCKADYRIFTRVNVQLQITCASDSYKFELQSNVFASGNTLSGSWTELTRRVAGQIVGSVNGDRIKARAEGQTFTALFSMTTRGNRQSVLIESPGSELSAIHITLRRQRR